MSVETVSGASPGDAGKRSRPSRLALALAGAACGGALVGATAAVASVTSMGQRTVVVVAAAPFTATQTVTPTAGLPTMVAAVGASVVAVTVHASGETDTGSGVVVRSDGMILTADHVLVHAGAISVTLADGRTSPARIVGHAAGTDLAVLQATALRSLPPATFASAKNVRPGDDVVAFGSPVGFADTVTRGIVSATHRSMPVDADAAPVDPVLGLPRQAASTAHIADAIQTDAAIEPGNSGGPLVDLHGHVIGIVTTLASPGADRDTDSGPAFAIPSDLAWATAKRLMSGH